MIRGISKHKKGFTRTPTLALLRSVFDKIELVFVRMKDIFYTLMLFRRNKNTMPKLVSGFTLVELIVSVSLFALIMVISMGSIVSVFDANQKSQTIRTVMDNLNFTLEVMTRSIRFGNSYHCDITQGDTTVPRDCATGASSIAIKASDGKRIIYKLTNGRIARSIDGGADYFLTSSDVTISSLGFRVFGSPLYNNGADLYQPQVIISVSGYSGTKATTQSSFTLETTVSQRMFDSQ
ncbi:MAG TPA: prepilin-type N-terminal cleavage/methylation domain-containing protein [Candidatus Paceibacterota bacterium]